MITLDQAMVILLLTASGAIVVATAGLLVSWFKR
jgi:hypothetical protein